MKYRTRSCSIVMLAAFLVTLTAMRATAAEGTHSKVAAIINQMPAGDSRQQEQLAAQLASLNPQAADVLIGMLLPPTDPNDTSARYGLSALTHYVGRDGREAKRAVYAKTLAEALPAVPDKQNQAFLIEQLQLVGNAEAIEPLAAFLGDDYLCDYAVRALLTINAGDIESAFLKALDAGSAATRPSLIKALGELQSRAAGARIAGYAMSSDEYTRETALYALANIGDPSSEPLLQQACNIGSDFEQLKHQSQYLLYAVRLAEGGNTDLAAAICTRMSQDTGRPEHIRAAADNTLQSITELIQDQSRAPAGFTSLFNGTDLTGWKRHDGLPGETQPTGKWFVEDGAIVGVQDPPGQGGFLTTTETFRDFELVLETQITWPFDSGVFLRVGPDGKSHQVTLDYCDGGEIGGIYCPWTHGFVHHCPDGINHFKKDQWNRLRILCQGQPARIQVWLNGTQITDFQHTEKTTAGIPEEGTICLQIHPGGNGYDQSQVRFRNIHIRPLEPAGPVNLLTAEEKAQGFVPLFNGVDLTGWVGSKDTYGVRDGVLFCRKGTGRNLYTEKEYGNFVLRFEFKLDPGTNNGLGIRTPLKGDAAYVGMELQILDNTADKYSNLQEWQYHGSVYGVVPAKRGFLKPVGQWNYQEVIADGHHITVNLNGTTLVNADVKQASLNGTLDGNEHPGLLNKTGHIGFLGHGDYVEFRNIRIRSLE